MRRIEVPTACGSRVLEVASSDVDDESGASIWDSALCLGEILVKQQISLGPRVLELGSGTGYVGLIAAALGHRTTLTDRAILLPQLQANIRANGLEDVADAVELEWGSVRPDLDVDTVIMSDCVYLPHCFRPLVQTLDSLAPSSIIWANEMRGVEEEFRKLMADTGWTFEAVPLPSENDFACEDICVQWIRHGKEKINGRVQSGLCNPVLHRAALALAWHQSLICAGFRREYKLYSERHSVNLYLGTWGII
ncbi:Protein-lysine methyltransferase METTL21D [Symbiodinium microadriaticum]|uniref:Protein-lysine methyltransferase METTL21D n=1 Tax=Symbiodinium microadriaticum TaxID=2951 RepID=A0A1Q9CUD3_SYMMI|nr:Protein-lysine methyltransferase METTL21D [Symbiodinium microadriaticum]